MKNLLNNIKRGLKAITLGAAITLSLGAVASAETETEININADYGEFVEQHEIVNIGYYENQYGEMITAYYTESEYGETAWFDNRDAGEERLELGQKVDIAFNEDLEVIGIQAHEMVYETPDGLYRVSEGYITNLRTNEEISYYVEEANAGDIIQIEGDVIISVWDMSRAEGIADENLYFVVGVDETTNRYIAENIATGDETLLDECNYNLEHMDVVRVIPGNRWANVFSFEECLNWDATLGDYI